MSTKSRKTKGPITTVEGSTLRLDSRVHDEWAGEVPYHLSKAIVVLPSDGNDEGTSLECHLMLEYL